MLNKLVAVLRTILVVSVPAGVAALVMAELVFRFVIPASNPPLSYFDAEREILRFDVGGPRHGRLTVGNLALQRTSWRVNNMGWNSEIDYTSGPRDKPLIAIIGDSTVQALDVDVGDSISSRLRQRGTGEYDVYSFAKGGGTLSQFLHLSRYVNEIFDPEILVFNVEANNFDQSLCDVAHPVGMMCLEDGSPEIQESDIQPYVSNRNRRWARKSSLIRYVVFNLGLSPSDRQADPGMAVQTSGKSDDVLLKERVVGSTDYVLARIARENPNKTVVFMVDTRKRLYDGNLAQEDDYRAWTRTLLDRKSDEYNHSFIDLTGAFSKDYQEYGQKFESLDGHHWNKRGHSVAAKALFETLKGIGVVQ